MLAQITHILPLTNIRRTRVLPNNGRVLVKPDQKINATDTIAESRMDGKHLLVDVRGSLGISKPQQVEKAIVRKVGDIVEEDDVIAESGGIFQRVVRAPAGGKIVTIQGGQVLLQIKDEPKGILAGYSGIVTEIIPERGAVIESSGALVQSAWGNGRIDQGMLLSLLRKPDDEFTRDQLDMSMRGAVILAGNCSSSKVLDAAADLILHGLILSSMSSGLVPLAEKLPFPVILIEGFGKIPLNSTAFQILTTNEKRDVCLFGVRNDFFNGERPEIFIPLPATAEPAPESDEFREGQMVRVKVAPYAGKVGVLVQVKSGSTLLSNGVRAPAAEVRLDTNEQVVVPLMNLDVLE